MFWVGEFRVHLINDAVAQMDAGGVFGLVPRALWSTMMPHDDNNRVPMAYHALLIQTPDKNILVDVGYGEIPDKQMLNWFIDRSSGGVTGALGRLGIDRHDIHLVIDTHLHGDHAGGNIMHDAAGQLVPTYPNAEYVVQRREYHDATHPNERTRATYLEDNYVPLVESGHMRLLDGDTELLPGVRGVVTPGHTPGHMSVIIENGGQALMFVCDLASYAIHFERLGWMTAYDVEPLVTLETKRIWQAWALKTNALLVFPHDTRRPMGRFSLDEKGRGVITPVPEPYA